MKKRLKNRNSSRGSPAARTVANLADSSGSPSTGSSYSSLKSDTRLAKSKRLLSQSRRFSDYKGSSDVIVDDDDDDERLFAQHADSSSNDGAHQRETSSFTDISQGSISYSTLADVMNDMQGEMSSSASRVG